MTEAAVPKVHSAIVAVMADLAKEGIGKNQKNAQQGYKFRGIDDVYNALAVILARNNLTIIPRVLSRQKETLNTQRGGVLFYVTVECEFNLTSAMDGSTVSVRTFGEAMDSADKATNKAMSAAYKYMALQTFCIPTEGDNDADATTHTIAKAPIPNLTHHPMGEDFPGCEPGATQSSYAAKKNGAGELFKQFQDEIAELTTMTEVGAFVKSRTQQIQEFPEAWRKILREKLDEQKHEISRLSGATEEAA